MKDYNLRDFFMLFDSTLCLKQKYISFVMSTEILFFFILEFHSEEPWPVSAIFVWWNPGAGGPGLERSRNKWTLQPISSDAPICQTSAWWGKFCNLLKLNPIYRINILQYLCTSSSSCALYVISIFVVLISFRKW